MSARSHFTALAVAAAAIAACDPATRIEHKEEKLAARAAETVDREIDLAVKQQQEQRERQRDQAEDRADVAIENQERVAAAVDELSDALVAFQEERAKAGADQGQRLEKAAARLDEIQAGVSSGKAKVLFGYDSRLAVAKGSLAAARQEVAGLASIDQDMFKAMKERCDAAVGRAEAAVDDVKDAVTH
jgi:hypothetical protein